MSFERQQGRIGVASKEGRAEVNQYLLQELDRGYHNIPLSERTVVANVPKIVQMSFAERFLGAIPQQKKIPPMQTLLSGVKKKTSPQEKQQLCEAKSWAEQTLTYRITELNNNITEWKRQKSLLLVKVSTTNRYCFIQNNLAQYKNDKNDNPLKKQFLAYNKQIQNATSELESLTSNNRTISFKNALKPRTKIDEANEILDSMDIDTIIRRLSNKNLAESSFPIGVIAGGAVFAGYMMNTNEFIQTLLYLGGGITSLVGFLNYFYGSKALAVAEVLKIAKTKQEKLNQPLSLQ